MVTLRSLTGDRYRLSIPRSSPSIINNHLLLRPNRRGVQPSLGFAHATEPSAATRGLLCHVMHLPFVIAHHPLMIWKLLVLLQTAGVGVCRRLPRRLVLGLVHGHAPRPIAICHQAFSAAPLDVLGTLGASILGIVLLRSRQGVPGAYECLVQPRSMRLLLRIRRVQGFEASHCLLVRLLLLDVVVVF